MRSRGFPPVHARIARIARQLESAHGAYGVMVAIL